MRGEEPERERGVAVVELGECVAFDWVAVAAVLGEADRVEPLGEGGEDAAGFDRGELVVVTDQDDLGVGAAGVVDEPCELAGADHGGFVDHHDRAAGEAGLGVAVERAEEAVEAARRDPGIGLELGGGAGGERAADDRVAGAFPHLAGDRQRVGLAGTGGTDDHRYAGPAGRERATIAACSALNEERARGPIAGRCTRRSRRHGELRRCRGRGVRARGARRSRTAHPSARHRPPRLGDRRGTARRGLRPVGWSRRPRLVRDQSEHGAPVEGAVVGVDDEREPLVIGVECRRYRRVAVETGTAPRPGHETFRAAMHALATCPQLFGINVVILRSAGRDRDRRRDRTESSPDSAAASSISIRRRLNSRSTSLESRPSRPGRSSGLPSNAERLAERVAELGLVQEPGRAGLRVQVPAVERPPHAVFAAGRVRDHHVGVQLRVAGPARAMPERRADQPPPSTVSTPLWPRRDRTASRSR